MLTNFPFSFSKEAIMSLTDIAHRINELASSWEQFKLINDRKLKEIESKGRADSAAIEQLCKVNNAIDSCKERLDLIETAAQRPEVNTDFSTSDKYFSDYIRKGIESGLSHKTLSGDDNRPAANQAIKRRKGG